MGTLPGKRFPRHKDPDEMCSYFRVIDDLQKVRTQLNLDDTDTLAQFLIYFALAEKLAASIDGLARGIVPSKIFKTGYQLNPRNISAGCSEIRFRFDASSIELLFKQGAGSAKQLRHDFMHRPGPSHLSNIRSEGPTLIPLMIGFLRGANSAKAYAKSHYP